ncbi:hypothetical protein AB0F05_34330 [Streptomyces microflavus]|uniref:hypothetical protein n=1 Tax=Streptomyces TaxID=1883 RepID=UPI0019113C30|nr:MULTISPECIES: hypothetical protein [Streptomyces]MBK5995229.1 hypothetical protein [Streptomyces sp. MBT58]WSR89295.1 hypothetical protein OG728_02270 [Streptomyces microflavus]
MRKRSLYDLYMAAAAAVREHDATCATCSPECRCTTGRRLYGELVRLQDNYLAQQKSKLT